MSSLTEFIYKSQNFSESVFEFGEWSPTVKLRSTRGIMSSSILDYLWPELKQIMIFMDYA